LLALALGSVAARGQAQANAASKGSDPTQSFVSPLGLGTGATIGVTQTGPSVTAAIARQVFNPAINFWQVGFSGTTDTNGQASVYSSHQSDAPGFKGKLGVGHSSFIRFRPVFTRTAGEFLTQAWCRDEVNEVNKTLPAIGQIKIPTSTDCKDAVSLEQDALKATPPVDQDGKVVTATQTADQHILQALAKAVETPADKVSLGPLDRQNVCNTVKDNKSFFQFCPDSTNPQPGLTDQEKKYPGLDTFTKDAPGKFQFKIWGSWAPTLTSTPYRNVTDGVPDLADKQNWTRLLNSGVGDVALYYGPWALGLEGGFGETVDIKAQNICKNIVSGTYTAQQCSMAMVGKPMPQSTWLASGTLQLSPLPIFGSMASLSSGAQVIYSYAAPTSGGHSSELAIPLYLSPAVTQMSFVIGIQPTWDWNTDPTIGHKFSVTVFIGARPPITKQ